MMVYIREDSRMIPRFFTGTADCGLEPFVGFANMDEKQDCHVGRSEGEMKRKEQSSVLDILSLTLLSVSK